MTVDKPPINVRSLTVYLQVLLTTLPLNILKTGVETEPQDEILELGDIIFANGSTPASNQTSTPGFDLTSVRSVSTCAGAWTVSGKIFRSFVSSLSLCTITLPM